MHLGMCFNKRKKFWKGKNRNKIWQLSFQYLSILSKCDVQPAQLNSRFKSLQYKFILSLFPSVSENKNNCNVIRYSYSYNFVVTYYNYRKSIPSVFLKTFTSTAITIVLKFPMYRTYFNLPQEDLLHAGFFARLIFYPENGSDKFLRNVGSY